MDDFGEDHLSTKREGNDLKIFYNTRWKPHRLNVISELKKLSKEAQKCKTDQRIGRLVYSSAGIVSGVMAVGGIVAAPFTAGLSLGLTAVSLGIGATAGAADVTHSVVANRMSESKVKAASKICEEDNELTKELKSHIDILDNKIRDINDFLKIMKEVSSTFKELGKGTVKIHSAIRATMAFKAIQAKDLEKAARILDMGKIAQKVIPDVFLQNASLPGKFRGVGTAAKTSGKFVRLTTKIALPLIIIGSVYDIYSLVTNAINLHDKKLSDHAKCLQDAAEELEAQMYEYDQEMQELLGEIKDI